MTENEAEPIVRIASKRSVDIALDLLRARSAKTSKRKRNDDTDETDCKVSSHCINDPIEKREKKTNAALGFSENYAISEMRNCLARHDWANLRELFPLLLGCYSELEPIVWRHALAILLCSPQSHSSNLREFFEMCIGAQTFEDTHVLERLLTLQSNDNE